MTTELNMPVILARRIEKVAEAKKIPFKSACIFLLKEVLPPRRFLTPKGGSTSQHKSQGKENKK